MPSTLRRLLRLDRKGPYAPSWFESRRTHGETLGLARDYLRDAAHVARVDDRLKPLLDDPAVIAAIERDTTPRPMPEGRLVFDYNPNSIEYNCNVFMHSRYIRKCWGKWFEVVGIHPLAHHGFQTVVVLRKRV